MTTLMTYDRKGMGGKCFFVSGIQMLKGREVWKLLGEVRSSCCMSRKGWKNCSGISGEVGDEELCAAGPMCSV